MKVSILTLGCKVNQAESAIIEGNLLQRGISIVPLSERPSYCIINTCTVTAKSDYQSRQLVRRAVRADAKVIVTGCYSQLRGPDISRIDGDIVIVDNMNKLSIIDMLSTPSETFISSFSDRSRPYLKVQDGCNSSCTYCTVPKARGRSRSVGLSDIINQAREFESQGYQEIILTGIHLGTYGRDLQHKLKLSDLIETILHKTRIPRVRLSSLEVNEIDHGILQLLTESRVCKHLHIPLQSGDDAVLSRMNRTYSSRDFLSAIEAVTNCAPGTAIGTDVIVGFPGEDDLAYSHTRDLLDSLPLSYMHIFPFSPRPGTAASAMQHQIPLHVKKRRASELSELNLRKKHDYAFTQRGRLLDVLVEDICDDGKAIGTSGNYLKVRISAQGCIKKSVVNVRITDADGQMLSGYPIESL